MSPPPSLIGRDREWAALSGFVDSGRRVAMVFGRRRCGVSRLVEDFASAYGGRVHRSRPGNRHVQLRRLERFLDECSETDRRPITSWASALDRVRRLETPLVVLDDVHLAVEQSPELTDALARYDELGHGPRIILAGTSPSSMLALLAHGTPLFGRVAMAVDPRPLSTANVARLWGVEDGRAAVWLDAVVGGMPGYRPLVAKPEENLEGWMTWGVLGAGSPLLDSAEAGLSDLVNGVDAPLGRSVLDAVAGGATTPDAIGAGVGLASDEVASALHVMERGGALLRVSDPTKQRRDVYEITDPYIRFWLSVVAPHRAALAAGEAERVWNEAGSALWREQLLPLRWRTIVREWASRRSADGTLGDGIVSIGETTGAELVGVNADRRVVLLGRSATGWIGKDDLALLQARAAALGSPDATPVMASMEWVNEDARDGAVVLLPSDLIDS